MYIPPPPDLRFSGMAKGIREFFLAAWYRVGCAGPHWAAVARRRGVQVSVELGATVVVPAVLSGLKTI